MPDDREELTLSASAIATFLSCEQKWAYRYRDRLELVYRAPALARGTAVHEALQLWWNGGEMSMAFREWYNASKQEMIPGEFEEWTNDYAHVVELLRRYREHYEAVPPGVSIVGTEVEINAKLDDKTRMRGYVDLVVTAPPGTFGENTPGGLYGIEFKTAANLKKRMAYLDWDMQPVVYAWGLEAMGMPVEGIIFDGLKTYRYKDLDKQEGGKLFQRKVIRPSDPQKKEMVRNSLAVAERIREAKDSDEFIRNLGGGCKMCDFKLICHADVEGDELKRDAAKRTRYQERQWRD